MLICNYLSGDKRQEALLRNEVGKPFTVLQKIRMKGAGSERMAWSQCSEAIATFYQGFNAIPYMNIELRPKGIIVHFAINTRRLAWAIPYFKLSIIQSVTFNLHDGKDFVKIQKVNKRQQAFLRRLMLLRLEFISSFN